MVTIPVFLKKDDMWFDGEKSCGHCGYLIRGVPIRISADTVICGICYGRNI